MKKILQEITDKSIQAVTPAAGSEKSDVSGKESRRGFLKKTAGLGAGISLGSFLLSPVEDAVAQASSKVNRFSNPSDLKITDMRYCVLELDPGGARSPLIRIDTNQGIYGLGEVRDGADERYALFLKSRILGENPCNVEMLFKIIKQFGYHGRQGGGVSGVEMALWDLKGKALSTQQKGNTGEQMTRAVLEVYGQNYGSLSKVNHGSYNDSVAQLKDNQAQVFSLITTVPASSVMDLASARDIRVLEVPDDKLKELQKLNAGYDKRIIKAGSYPKQDKDIQTIGTWTHLIARCDLPEDTVYKITKALAENIPNLSAVVSAVKELTPKDMAIDIGVPYHKGALKYYKEAKVL